MLCRIQGVVTRKENTKQIRTDRHVGVYAVGAFISILSCNFLAYVREIRTYPQRL